MNPRERSPSSLVRPVGSLEAEMPAEDNDRQPNNNFIRDIMADYSAGGLLANKKNRLF